MNRANEDVMAAIRAATHPQHESLEANANILERVCTPAGYAGLIAVFSRLHDTYEPQIQSFELVFRNFGFSLAPRGKCVLLRADAACVYDRFGVRVASQPLPAHAAVRIETFAEAVGWLYVFEGSTLGGTLIAQSARAQLGIGTSYFGVYGARTADMWRQFGDFVRSYVAQDCSALPAVVEGAKTAFALVQTALADAPPA